MKRVSYVCGFRSVDCQSASEDAQPNRLCYKMAIWVVIVKKHSIPLECHSLTYWFLYPANLIVDSENKFTFFQIYVSLYDYGIFNRFTQTRA